MIVGAASSSAGGDGTAIVSHAASRTAKMSAAGHWRRFGVRRMGGIVPRKNQETGERRTTKDERRKTKGEKADHTAPFVLGRSSLVIDAPSHPAYAWPAAPGAAAEPVPAAAGAGKCHCLPRGDHISEDLDRIDREREDDRAVLLDRALSQRLDVS